MFILKAVLFLPLNKLEGVSNISFPTVDKYVRLDFSPLIWKKIYLNIWYMIRRRQGNRKSFCTVKSETRLFLSHSFLPRTLPAILKWPSTAVMYVYTRGVHLWGRSMMGQVQKSISPLAAQTPWPLCLPGTSKCWGSDMLISLTHIHIVQMRTMSAHRPMQFVRTHQNTQSQ